VGAHPVLPHRRLDFTERPLTSPSGSADFLPEDNGPFSPTAADYILVERIGSVARVRCGHFHAAADMRERAEPNASSFSHCQIEGEPAMKSKECVAAIVCLLCFAVHASAQDDAPAASANVPRIQIAAGYSFLRELDVHQSIPGGWFISADKNINDHVAITYDLSASGILTRHRVYLPGGVSRWGTGAVLLGPTFANRANARFVWFSRVLGGFANAGNSEDGYAVALAVAPGVGLDVNFNRHVGVRTTADYRSLFGIGTAAGERASEMWLRTGLVVSLGAR
jgi:hypothetical protein